MGYDPNTVESEEKNNSTESTFQKHNFRSGQILTAAALNEIEDELVRVGSNFSSSADSTPSKVYSIYDYDSYEYIFYDDDVEGLKEDLETYEGASSVALEWDGDVYNLDYYEQWTDNNTLCTEARFSSLFYSIQVCIEGDNMYAYPYVKDGMLRLRLNSSGNISLNSGLEYAEGFYWALSDSHETNQSISLEIGNFDKMIFHFSGTHFTIGEPVTKYIFSCDDAEFDISLSAEEGEDSLEFTIVKADKTSFEKDEIYEISAYSNPTWGKPNYEVMRGAGNAYKSNIPVVVHYLVDGSVSNGSGDYFMEDVYITKCDYSYSSTTIDISLYGETDGYTYKFSYSGGESSGDGYSCVRNKKKYANAGDGYYFRAFGGCAFNQSNGNATVTYFPDHHLGGIVDLYSYVELVCGLQYGKLHDNYTDFTVKIANVPKYGINGGETYGLYRYELYIMRDGHSIGTIRLHDEFVSSSSGISLTNQLDFDNGASYNAHDKTATTGIVKVVVLLTVKNAFLFTEEIGGTKVALDD